MASLVTGATAVGLPVPAVPQPPPLTPFEHYQQCYQREYTRAMSEYRRQTMIDHPHIIAEAVSVEPIPTVPVPPTAMAAASERKVGAKESRSRTLPLLPDDIEIRAQWQKLNAEWKQSYIDDVTKDQQYERELLVHSSSSSVHLTHTCNTPLYRIHTYGYGCIFK